ncbi:putative serine/threonine-protein phosphatase 2A 56 kDa regulatory subunit gamma isoform [Triplophysa rosa]|uniref:Serine/threonine-protein phosphatase 2A 56 kDa regulatory subunit gamma isoform n=1 Tax=Triplophysa rosa TaxID=992332 RepID=A0A9W7TXA8_TRIRA|nr:putative serine/threonine-protein phosphatase 2A 56 kDa regulatory subunit gamma isoform [Triplophysa rosa]
MPNKSKKDKSVRSSRSSSKHHGDKQNSEKQSSPPTTQLLRVKHASIQSAPKKHRRLSSSCFSISNNRELLTLSHLRVIGYDGQFYDVTALGCSEPMVYALPADVTDRFVPLAAAAATASFLLEVLC